MAGNYPDVPGPRLAYDRDGSLGFWLSGGSVTTLLTSYMQQINNEADDGPEYGDGKWGIIFPELRDIVGFGAKVGSAGGYIYPETSVDTTTGLDGTWVTRTPNLLNGGSGWTPSPPNNRTQINSVSWSGIKGIRFSADHGGDTHWYGMHIYGRIASGQTPDRLRLWHPTLDQALDDQSVSPDGAYFDWGNVPQGTTQDRTFRVKNNSSTLTANTVTVSTDSTNPLAIPDVLTLSKDGTTFASTISFTSIAPGGLTGVCTVRRTTPSNATLSLAVMRILAAAASWS